MSVELNALVTAIDYFLKSKIINWNSNLDNKYLIPSKCPIISNSFYAHYLSKHGHTYSTIRIVLSSSHTCTLLSNTSLVTASITTNNPIILTIYENEIRESENLFFFYGR